MRISIIETGFFKLDGGAMFGVVPKSMWNRLNPADEKNLCTWAMRCLLVEEGDRKILIDTGIGNKQNEKFRSHFEPHGVKTLISSLADHGVTPEDITDVLLTHMHFDHIGGAIIRDGDHLIPQFPNATYWSNEQHYKWAIDPNPREAASFLKENILPLKEHKVLKFIDVEQGVSFTDRISLHFVYGHTEAMMLPHIKMDDGRTLIYTADLVPSSHHVRMPYVMAYDIRPLDTLKEKSELYERASGMDSIFLFEHDPAVEAGVLKKDDRGRWKLGYGGDLAII